MYISGVNVGVGEFNPPQKYILLSVCILIINNRLTIHKKNVFLTHLVIFFVENNVWIIEFFFFNIPSLTISFKFIFIFFLSVIDTIKSQKTFHASTLLTKIEDIIISFVNLRLYNI